MHGIAFTSVTKFTGCSKALKNTKRKPISQPADSCNNEFENLRT